MNAAFTTEEVLAKIARLRELRDQTDAELDKWARLVAYRERPKVERRSRLIDPECGTESGYQRHRYRGEKCDECKAAHAAHEKDAAVARRMLLDDIIDGAA